LTTDPLKKKLIDDLMKVRTDDKYKALFEALEKGDTTIEMGGKRTDAAFVLLNFINSKANAAEIIKQIKDNLQTPDLKEQLGEKNISAILKTLDNEGLGGLSMSSISSSALKGMTSGAVVLGNFLAPRIDSVDENGNPLKDRKNVTNIQLLWYPQTHLHYKKGKSNPGRDPKNIKYGDFVVIIEPEKYNSPMEFFSQMFDTVEDLLTNVLNGCTNMLCTEGTAKPQYYRKDYMTITNNQPQKDYEERMERVQNIDRV
jgi:hypothetical protein